MENLYIEPGRSTPEILLRPEVDIFSFSGNSYPVDPVSFYQPVLDWFEGFLSRSDEEKEITIRFELDYFNTASSKQIAKLLRLFEDYPAGGRITIRWQYNPHDVDMREAGERFKKFSKLKFELKPTNNR
jgi:hypothetical protein